jgi:hypothetical protein
MRVRQPDDREENDAEHEGAQNESAVSGGTVGFVRLML